MSDPFLGEIRAFGFNFAPTGWAFCNGQLLPITQNTALFSLLGTTYGGDGRVTFALPNLQGLAPIHEGQGPGLSLIDLGQTGGQTTVTLLGTEMPGHNHSVAASTTAATANVPAANSFTAQGGGTGRGAFKIRTYASSGTATTFAPSVISPAGGNLPHNNLQPTLVLNFCIALQGIFPPRS